MTDLIYLFSGMIEIIIRHVEFKSSIWIFLLTDHMNLDVIGRTTFYVLLDRILELKKSIKDE